MNGRTATATRSRRALFALVVFCSLIVFLATQGMEVRAEARFVKGTPDADLALAFDPYTLGPVETTTAEPNAPQPLLDAPAAPGPEDAVPGMPGGHPWLPDIRSWLPPVGIWVPIRPPRASPHI